MILAAYTKLGGVKTADRTAKGVGVMIGKVANVRRAINSNRLG